MSSRELGLLSRITRNSLALMLNPTYPLSKNWEDLSDEMGFTTTIAENIKARCQSPFHCLLKLWEETGHASLSELVYRLRCIKREDCIDVLRKDLAQVLSKTDLDLIMEKSKGPFNNVYIPEERVDVWNELEEDDKYHVQSDLPEVYLSYHLECQSEAKDLAKKLEDRGLTVLADFWFTKERREMGEVQWRENAMKMARKILVLCSPGYKKACERVKTSSSHQMEEDVNCRIDYNYIVTDILFKNFINKKTLIVRMNTGPANACVPQQLMTYPPILWRSMSTLPDDLLRSIWDKQKYKKPVVQRKPVIPPTYVDSFPKKRK